MSKLLIVTAMLVFAITPVLFAANLWQDNFNDNKINAVYKTPNAGGGAGPPKWVEEGGVLKQTEAQPGDPTYCAVELAKDINFCGQPIYGMITLIIIRWTPHTRLQTAKQERHQSG